MFFFEGKIELYTVLYLLVIPVGIPALMFFIKRKLLWVSPILAIALGTALTAFFYPYFFTDLFSSNNDIGGGSAWLIFALPIHCAISVVITSILYAVNYFRTRNKKSKSPIAPQIFFALCLSAFALCLSSCASYRYSQNCETELKGVSMNTEKAAYAPDEGIINVVWKNRTFRSLMFGNSFHIERKTSNGWEKIGSADFPVVFTDIGYELLPLVERKHSYNVRAYANSLEIGTYRIVTSFSDNSSDVSTRYSLSVEFNVE
jgi:hypothetical protein